MIIIGVCQNPERCILFFSLLLRPARPARAGHVRGNYEEGARPETFSILGMQYNFLCAQVVGVND